jgi:N-acetyl-alpha-D-glucosaminyl L-malate synthase BshA
VIATGLAVALSERGHRVHVIANAPPRRALPQSERLSFHQVAAADYPLFDHPPYALALAAALVEISQRHHLDLVNVHYAIPHAASAYLARQTLGSSAPRVVTTLHGTDVTRLGADPRYRSVTRFTVAASDGITVPSQFLRDEAHRCLGLPAEPPIEVIANFVDTEVFAPPERRDARALDGFFDGATGSEPTLLHVSNFRPVKRTTDLIEVLARVRQRIPARLLLVGDGPDRPRTAQRAEELGLGAHVRFLGDHPDFATFAKHADVFLLTSESESFGVAALEALSCGVPVCGYRVGGLPEVVVDGVGRLVTPFDLDHLAEAVVEVVADPVRRDQMGRAARAHAESRFRRAAAVDHYEAYFRAIVERR